MNLKYDFERKDFLSSVNKIKEYINQGDVMQVVLSQRMTIIFMKGQLNFIRNLGKLIPHHTCII